MYAPLHAQLDRLPSRSVLRRRVTRNEYDQVQLRMAVVDTHTEGPAAGPVT